MGFEEPEIRSSTTPGDAVAIVEGGGSGPLGVAANGNRSVVPSHEAIGTGSGGWRANRTADAEGPIRSLIDRGQAPAKLSCGSGTTRVRGVIPPERTLGQNVRCGLEPQCRVGRPPVVPRSYPRSIGATQSPTALCREGRVESLAEGRRPPQGGRRWLAGLGRPGDTPPPPPPPPCAGPSIPGPRLGGALRGRTLHAP
jgi:hypothetical protein